MIEPLTHRLLWIFLLLNGCDILTTEVGLSIGGEELNPLANLLLQHLGHWSLYALKGLIIGATCIYWAFQYQANPTQVQTILTLQNVVFGLVIAWNSIMILLGLLGLRLPEITRWWENV